MPYGVTRVVLGRRRPLRRVLEPAPGNCRRPLCSHGAERDTGKMGVARPMQPAAPHQATPAGGRAALPHHVFAPRHTTRRRNSRRRATTGRQAQQIRGIAVHRPRQDRPPHHLPACLPVVLGSPEHVHGHRRTVERHFEGPRGHRTPDRGRHPRTDEAGARRHELQPDPGSGVRSVVHATLSPSSASGDVSPKRNHNRPSCSKDEPRSCRPARTASRCGCERTCSAADPTPRELTDPPNTSRYQLDPRYHRALPAPEADQLQPQRNRHGCRSAHRTDGFASPRRLHVGNVPLPRPRRREMRRQGACTPWPTTT